jgi:ATP-dependent Zn protease
MAESRRKKDGRGARVTRKGGIKAVAYHEAAHAVVAHLLGVSVLRVTIEPSASGLGFAEYSHPRWFGENRGALKR